MFQMLGIGAVVGMIVAAAFMIFAEIVAEIYVRMSRSNPA